ncbi:unnamed protein product [Discosporangium mesarthrocarpum]
MNHLGLLIMIVSTFLGNRVAGFVTNGLLRTGRRLAWSPSANPLSMQAGAEKVGFIGLGIMGDGMARNLINGGSDLVVWNRSGEKAEAFSSETGCEVAKTPKEVVEKCGVTISMLSTPEAASDVFYRDDGVLAGLGEGKSIIDCATLRTEDMEAMYKDAKGAGALFLEAPVSGSKAPAANGQLIFLCGGDKELFDSAQGYLELMGKANYYLGPAGKGTEMKLVVNMIMGTMLASLAEGMCLADSLGLENNALVEILGLGAMANPMFNIKGPLMEKKDYSPNFPLKHAQKDIRFALGLGEEVDQPLPVAAAANAEYKRASSKYGDDDFCAVIEALRSKP